MPSKIFVRYVLIAAMPCVAASTTAPVTPALAQGFLRVSAVLPITDEERERWATPRPEPVTLDLQGWAKSSSPKNPTFPNRHVISFQSGACSVAVVRDWDLALTPGYPATIESSRPVTVAGHQVELLTVMEFASGSVQKVGLSGKGYHVKYQVVLRLRNCPEDVVNDVLTRIVVHW